MSREAVLGVDIGTSSSKGVLVGPDGTVLASAVQEHRVERPAPGHVEMDGQVWWQEFVTLTRRLLRDPAATDVHVVAVGVSGMGPCVLVTDADGTPLRPAILYGIDTRSAPQVAELTAELGDTAIRDRCGSSLSTQAVGPKLSWLAEHEPAVHAAARRLFMPASWLAYRLTGAYVLDRHSASQCTPMFDAASGEWYRPWADRIAPELELPPLRWPGEQAGTVTSDAAAQTGLRPGIPVITGTIDAWSEAVSAGAHRVGDLMLMYGTTMFLICTVPDPVTSPTLWGTVGAFPGTHNLAGGMATSGAITSWLNDLFAAPGYERLVAEARASGPGAHGLLMLPYFAGERTPVQDPTARGVIIGLTVEHTRGDLYRAALEATALGVRHNLDTMAHAGAKIDRVVAVGGGTTDLLWPQIVCDVVGLPQVVPTRTIGASYGAAFLAASLVHDVAIDAWNPPRTVLTPDPQLADGYDRLYGLYRDLYPSTLAIAHALASPVFPR